MLYIKICYFICVSLVMFKGLYFLLTILQEDHYDILPYTKSFFCFYFLKNYNYILYLLIIIALFENVYLYILGLILCCIVATIKDKLLLRLKFTKRIIRLIATLLLIYLVVFILTKSFLVVMVGYLLTPFVVILSCIINLPLELLIKKHYINQAKKKLNKLKSIVKIGITGSYGKTSTKNIITGIVENNYLTVKTPASYNTIMGITKVINNNLNSKTEVFVCEMGASKVNEIKKMTKLIKPDIRVITDVGFQHISTFKSLENVIIAKFELLNTNNEDSIIVLNGDNENIRSNSENFKNVTYYGLNKTNTFNARNITSNTSKTTFDIYNYDKYIMNIETKLLGLHNVKNILSAYAITKCLKRKNIDISDDTFKETIRKIEQTPHRLSYKQVGNIHIYDDSYNANIVGFKNGVDVLKESIYKKIIITPGIVEAGNKEQELNEEVASTIENVFDDIYIIDNISGRYIYNKLTKTPQVKLVKSFQDAYQDVLKNNQHEEVALLIANDLPDNYLVRRKKNVKKER